MGDFNFREFPSPVETGRTTTTSPVIRAGLRAPFVDVMDVVAAMPEGPDADGVPRPRPRRRDDFPFDDEDDLFELNGNGRRRRRAGFGGRFS